MRQASQTVERQRDYLEMNNLFEEFGVEDNASPIQKGKAYMYGYNVLRTYDGLKLDMHIYFLNSEEEILVSKLTHEKENPHPLIKHLRSKNNNTIELDSMVGTEITVINEEDKWELKYTNVELEEFVHFDEDWEPTNTSRDNDKFIKFYKKEKPTVKIGDGIISDYYVRKSASNITQELEIGLTVQLPDGSEEEYECIHDKEHKDELLEYFLQNYASDDSIMSLKGKKVPVAYCPEEDSWCFHVKKGYFAVNYYLERFGVKGSLNDKYQYKIYKNYKHANGR